MAPAVAEPREVSFPEPRQLAPGYGEPEPTPIQKFRRAGLAVKAASRIRRVARGVLAFLDGRRGALLDAATMSPL